MGDMWVACGICYLLGNKPSQINLDGINVFEYTTPGLAELKARYPRQHPLTPKNEVLTVEKRERRSEVLSLKKRSQELTEAASVSA